MRAYHRDTLISYTPGEQSIRVSFVSTNTKQVDLTIEEARDFARRLAQVVTEMDAQSVDTRGSNHGT